MKNFAVTAICVFFIACTKPYSIQPKVVDVALIGGGIMSATLGSFLRELDGELSIEVFEQLSSVAQESSAAWNNAGTGHAALAELNYTNELLDGSIDIKKAIEINESFELSKQFWAYAVEHKKISSARSFIYPVPHMSFVWGDKNIEFLKKRYVALQAHPLFQHMEYSEDPVQISQWAPLIMEGRDPHQKVAATRAIDGTDVNFGALTGSLFKALGDNPNTRINLNHEVKDLKHNEDRTWSIIVKDMASKQEKLFRAKFVFIGAGGDSLLLLQKSKIPESKGFGGFPVGGQWLVTNNPDLVNRHAAKVYGKASVGSPPMSVPHLDSRYIDGQKALLFGPFATFSTKFLKNGSWVDLPTSISWSNMVPMLQVGWRNFDLTKYLIKQVLLSPEERLVALKEYLPNAQLNDWQLRLAGQRVQIIKKDPIHGGILQFGTELISDQDAHLIALLGASPGASTAVKVALDILEKAFKQQLKSQAWQAKLRDIIPSYGQKLAKQPELLELVRKRNKEFLQLTVE